MNCIQNNISYRDELVNSQSFIRDYVKCRIYNSSDASDVVQEINRVAIEKESDYNKDFWKEKSIKKQSTFERWISGISKFQVMAFLTRNKEVELYMSMIFMTKTKQ